MTSAIRSRCRGLHAVSVARRTSHLDCGRRQAGILLARHHQIARTIRNFLNTDVGPLKICAIGWPQILHGDMLRYGQQNREITRAMNPQKTAEPAQLLRPCQMPGRLPSESGLRGPGRHILGPRRPKCKRGNRLQSCSLLRMTETVAACMQIG